MSNPTYGKTNGKPHKPPAERNVSPASPKESPRAVLTGKILRTVYLKGGNYRSIWLGLAHVLVFSFVYWLAFSFRFDFVMPEERTQMFLWTLPWVVAVKLLVFSASGYYQGWWAHVTFSDLITLVRSAVLSLLIITSLDFFLCNPHLPRTILILDFALGILALGVVRSSWRLFRECVSPVLNPKDGRRSLLVGTDHATGVLAHQIEAQSELPYQIEGLLVTDGARAEKRLGQFPVLGHVNDVKEIAANLGVADVLMTAGILPGNQLRRLMNNCREAGLALKIIPALEDRLNGDASIPIRSIEINDLLGRDPVELDTNAIGRLIEGATIMVTGAGGSIGSEICRQVLRFNPRTLVLVGRGENRIFHVERELRSLNKSTVLHARIGDVNDKARMRKLFEEHRPEVVFHAAAHKHVPLMEANISEAIKNNVGGTKCVADLADQFGAKSFVLISTDKAVRPSNVMGASKHLAEQYVLALSQESSTRFSVVRFGNVLGSAGSVVPIFQEQIRRGGPITITDPRMTRYFMTIPEASQLVLQAATMGRGGEIFVLDMGEPVRIVDLARDMIRLAGLPEHAIEIMYTGIRPGEKLHEELYSDDEQTLPTTHSKLRAAYHRPYSLAEVRQMMSELQHLVNEPDDVLRRKLHALIPEFSEPALDDKPQAACKLTPST